MREQLQGLVKSEWDFLLIDSLLHIHVVPFRILNSQGPTVLRVNAGRSRQARTLNDRTHKQLLSQLDL